MLLRSAPYFILFIVFLLYSIMVMVETFQVMTCSIAHNMYHVIATNSLLDACFAQFIHSAFFKINVKD